MRIIVVMDTTLMQTSSRTLPPRLAPIVAGLELRAATTVDASEIARLAGVEPGSVASRDIVRRLVDHRWLRPLPVRGRYEFLPGAAVANSRNDDLDPLRAIGKGSGGPLQVALAGAAFLRGFSDRAPRRYDILVPQGRAVSATLRSLYRVHWVAPRRLSGGKMIDGVLASTRERLLIDVALWPAVIVQALQLQDHWLGAALEGASSDLVLDLLRDLDSAFATARAGYLAERFGRPDIADRIASLGRSRVTVPLVPSAGSSSSLHRDHRFNVLDPFGVASRA